MPVEPALATADDAPPLDRLARRAAVPHAAVAAAALAACLYRFTRHERLTVAGVEDEGATVTVDVAADTRFVDVLDAMAAAVGGLDVHAGAVLVTARPDDGGPEVVGRAVLAGAGADFSILAGLDPKGRRRCATAAGVLLADAARRPDARVGSLATTGDAEVARAASRVNAAAVRYPDLPLLHAPFEAAAARCPEATAVESGATRLTYRQLERRANRLAHRLVTAGVRPEDCVGICTERSVAQIVAVLGVLKAGAGFVPLDPRQPRDRLAAVAAAAPLRVVLTEPAPAPASAALPGPRLVVTEGGEPEEGEAAEPPQVAIAPSNVACVYYTSGSTGRPKGVVIDHRCASGRMEWLARRYALGRGERVVVKTPLVFDVSLWEILLPLGAGATILLAEPRGESDVTHLGELLSADGTALAHFVPSMLGAYLDLAPSRRYPSLRFVQTSGEAMTPALLDRFASHFEVDLHNLYGQTETSEVAGWEGRRSPDPLRVPMGRQLGIYRLFVLDESLRMVPPGVAGELCVAGDGGLARGYRHDPRLTAERFVPNPYAIAAGERLYRTGDLAMVDDDGMLWFLGRIDTQLKIRGCRVEPAEVEAVLARHPDVRAAAVVALPDDDGSPRLVAYLAGGDVPLADVAAHAERHLPSYMLPSTWVRLPELPVTASGKLDRARLPEPQAADRAALVAGDEPRTPLEERLCELWQDVLHLARVGRDDNFFGIGGNSLQSLQMLNRVRASLGVAVSVRELFDDPTVAGVAEAVERHLADAIAAMSDEQAASLLKELGG